MRDNKVEHTANTRVVCQVPEDKIKYPAPDFVDRLVDMKQPGDTAVYWDRPQMHFYVAVLLERAVPPMTPCAIVGMKNSML